MRQRTGWIWGAVTILCGCGGNGDRHMPALRQGVELAPIPAVADTTLRAANPYANYGTSLTLGVTSASIASLQRSLIRFNPAAIVSAVGTETLHAARVDLTITGVSVGWLGGKIDILPMTRDWPEGNGLLGHGPSWVCANDTNTTLFGNLFNNCGPSDHWGMLPTDPRPLPFDTVATDRRPVFTGGLGVISFDVTRDVRGCGWCRMENERRSG
jgi:hypothetical protein